MRRRLPAADRAGGDWRDAAASDWRPGGASLVWHQAALDSLRRDLVSRYGAGASIVYRKGPYGQALLEVGQARGGCGITHVCGGGV